MNLAPLTPVVVTLAISGLMTIGGREHHKQIGGTAVYKLPSVYFYLMVAGSVFFGSVPFWPGVTNGSSDGGFIAFGIFAMLPLIAAYYFHRYQVTINGQQITARIFSVHQFEIADIASYELQSGRGAELRLKLRNGTKVNISGLITDFDSLVKATVGDVKPQS